MPILPLLALIADTVLVRPVDVPTPWYSVASGVLSIVVTLLLLGIATALLGMARAVRNAEHRLGGRMQTLSDELVPLARNLNQIATQLAEVTHDARADLKRLSGTVGAVDNAVRSVIDAGEERFARLSTLLDAVQDEAEETVSTATSVIHGVREGARSFLSDTTRRTRSSSARRERRRPNRDTDESDDDDLLVTEAEIRARLSELEAALHAEVPDSDDGLLHRDADEEMENDAHAGVGEHRSAARGPRIRRQRK
jgi:hypothetical protein